jgi:hypothetical protein
MRAVATCAVVAGLMAMTPSAGVRADSPVALTVRVYNTSGIPAPELVAARHVAESILGDVGLNVVFRHCGRRVSPEAPLDSCNESLRPSEVVVRVINAPAFSTSLHSDAYGLTYVVRETNRGWLATVFSDRIDHAAARVGVEPGTLLGRVMAHEVGHLLLGTHYHGQTGLMLAEWPDALLTRTAEAWRFSMLEAARMQRVLASIAG